MTTAAQPSSALRILCRTTAAVALLSLAPVSGAMAQVMPTKDSAPLAARATGYTVARAATYAERWSDHAPVIVDYAY